MVEVVKTAKWLLSEIKVVVTAIYELAFDVGGSRAAAMVLADDEEWYRMWKIDVKVCDHCDEKLCVYHLAKMQKKVKKETGTVPDAIRESNE